MNTMKVRYTQGLLGVRLGNSCQDRTEKLLSITIFKFVTDLLIHACVWIVIGKGRGGPGDNVTILQWSDPTWMV